MQRILRFVPSSCTSFAMVLSAVRIPHGNTRNLMYFRTLSFHFLSMIFALEDALACARSWNVMVNRLAHTIYKSQPPLLKNGLTLVTHNTQEFSRISGLKLVDWEA